MVVVVLNLTSFVVFFGVISTLICVGFRVIKGTEDFYQFLRLVSNLLVKIDQPRIRVVDGPIPWLNIEEQSTTTEERLMLALVLFGKTRIELVQQLPLPAGPLENGLYH